MNIALRRVGIATVVLIVVLIGQLTYLQVIDADNLANNPKNVRAALRDANRARGPIVTADGEVVARSERIHDNTEFDYQRQYPLGSLFSQVAGYQSFVFGNTGVEKTYNDQLIGRDAELQLKNIEDIGSDTTGTVVLSMTAAAQRTAAEALGSQHGSVVLLDVQSGAVVAMYSNPSYDPNPLTGHDSKAVQQYFRQLTSDPSKPDLARAYRERYPPGSTFKVITATSAIEKGVATPDTEFPVRSELPLPQSNNTIQNFGGESCGGTLFESFTESCNTPFARLGLELGNDFVSAMGQFGIGDAPPLDAAPGAVGSIGPLESEFDNNDPEFALAGIGQGQVAVTPLEMALAAARREGDPRRQRQPRAPHRSRRPGVEDGHRPRDRAGRQRHDAVRRQERYRDRRADPGRDRRGQDRHSAGRRRRAPARVVRRIRSRGGPPLRRRRDRGARRQLRERGNRWKGRGSDRETHAGSRARQVGCRSANGGRQ